jgi:hypothetical protein
MLPFKKTFLLQIFSSFLKPPSLIFLQFFIDPITDLRFGGLPPNADKGELDGRQKIAVGNSNSANAGT